MQFLPCGTTGKCSNLPQRQLRSTGTWYPWRSWRCCCVRSRPRRPWRPASGSLPPLRWRPRSCGTGSGHGPGKNWMSQYSTRVHNKRKRRKKKLPPIILPPPPPPAKWDIESTGMATEDYLLLVGVWNNASTPPPPPPPPTIDNPQLCDPTAVYKNFFFYILDISELIFRKPTLFPLDNDCNASVCMLLFSPS